MPKTAPQHDRFRFDARFHTGGWGVLNLRTAASLAGTELTLGVENVFDRLYRGHLDPYTLYRPGRNMFVRMTRAF